MKKYLIKIDDPHGYKGACWYYSTKASSEQEAVEIAKKKNYLLRNYPMHAFISVSKNSKKLNTLKYFEGDPRL